MKKILLFFAMLLVTTIAMGQIKVLNTGNVLMGATTVCHPLVQLQIDKNGGQIAIGPNDSGSNIGSTLGQIDFWHPVGPKWNKVKFSGYALSSDSAFKRDVFKITNATDILKKVKTYSYYFKSDPIGTGAKDYGVLAQEIQTILPELVDTAKGNMFVNYNAFIGILIAGFNEQQLVIDRQIGEISTLQKIVFEQEKDIVELRKIIAEFNGMLDKCCNNSKGGQAPPEEAQQPQEKAVLYQNAPNPFSSNTEIACFLPEKSEFAVLYIYNLQGIELKSYSVRQAGFNIITVTGSELPAGMYLYTLVVDNEIVDTKRMILTK